jgi:hypothetical protein
VSGETRTLARLPKGCLNTGAVEPLDCGSFVLSETLVSECIQVTAFFDSDGEAIRILSLARRVT